MGGHPDGDLVRAHADSRARLGPGPIVLRELREERERQTLRPGATLAVGAGHRARPEDPDDERTCFERDRDRIVHSTAFRRLAGKTQVVVYPDRPSAHPADPCPGGRPGRHLDRPRRRGQRHAGRCDRPGPRLRPRARRPCERGRVRRRSSPAATTTALGRRRGARPASTCAPRRWTGSATTPGPGRRRPTVEGEIVSWADRIAYCAHDLEDAVHAGHRDRGRPSGRGRRGLRADPARAARTPSSVRSYGRSRSTARSGCRRRGRGAGRVAGVQLRADLRPARRRSLSPAPWSRCCGPWSSTTSPTLDLLPEPEPAAATRSAPPSPTSPA